MQVSLALVLAVGVQAVTVTVSYVVTRYSLLLNHGDMPYTDKRDVLAILGVGTATAVSLAASHYILTW